MVQPRSSNHSAVLRRCRYRPRQQGNMRGCHQILTPPSTRVIGAGLGSRGLADRAAAPIRWIAARRMVALGVVNKRDHEGRDSVNAVLIRVTPASVSNMSE